MGLCLPCKTMLCFWYQYCNVGIFFIFSTFFKDILLGIFYVKWLVLCRGAFQLFSRIYCWLQVDTGGCFQTVMQVWVSVEDMQCDICKPIGVHLSVMALFFLWLYNSEKLQYFYPAENLQHDKVSGKYSGINLFLFVFLNCTTKYFEILCFV